jgi:hypothetical protein
LTVKRKLYYNTALGVNMKRKLTFTIRTAVLKRFNEAIRAAGLRRDSYLNHVLPDEIDELLPLSPNSERGERQLRDMRRFLYQDFSKVNIALEQEVAEKLNEVCREKRIPRDIFIEEFMEFLSKTPENGSYAAPLAMIYELKNDPRYQYDRSLDDKCPYDWLSVSDDKVQSDFEQMRNLLQQAYKRGRKE